MKKSISWNIGKLENFVSSLHQLLQANIPLPNALDLLSHHLEKKAEAELAKNLKQKISRGITFSIAWEEITGEKLTYALLHAGEQAGLLIDMLEHIKCFAKIENKIKTMIWEALRYPLLLSIITLLILSALSLWIIPQFSSLYASFNIPLPPLTASLVKINNWCSKNLLSLIFLILTFLGSIYLFSLRLKQNGVFLYLKQKIGFFRFQQELHFWHTISLLLKAGISFNQALSIALPIIQYSILYQPIEYLIQQLKQGKSASTILKKLNFFSPKLIMLIALGEETGELPQTLSSYVNQLNAAMENKINNFKFWLEPIFLLIISGLIGIIVTALYLPIVQLGKWI